MISVIIPVYNVGELLCHSVESVLCQINNEHEIIIVDDGSTDNSGIICDSYVNKSNIVVVHKENGGLSSARNAGVNVARGDYLIFLDSDDYLRQGTLKLLSDVLEKCSEKPDFVQFQYKEVTDYSDKASVDCIPVVEELSQKSKMFERMLNLGGIGASGCTKLIARRIFEKVRFKEGILHEDEQFTIHLIDNSRRAAYIDSDLYLYVIRQGSIITSAYTHRKLDIIPIFEEQIEILKHNNLEELANRVRGKLFTVLCSLYVRARHIGEYEDARYIKHKLCTMAYSGGLPPMSSSIRLIFWGLKFRISMMELYYYYTKTKKWLN